MKRNWRTLKMRKPPISAEKIKIQPEPVVDQPATSPAAAYVESVRITPERLWNTVLKNHHQQGGPSEH